MKSWDRILASEHVHKWSKYSFLLFCYSYLHLPDLPFVLYPKTTTEVEYCQLKWAISREDKYISFLLKNKLCVFRTPLPSEFQLVGPFQVSLSGIFQQILFTRRTRECGAETKEHHYYAPFDFRLVFRFGESRLKAWI